MSAATDFSIKHSIPGRLRVIFPALVSQKDLTRNLETNLSNTPGINRVQSNHFCGSVTIKYNPEIFDRQHILEVIKGVHLNGPVPSNTRISRVKKQEVVQDHPPQKNKEKKGFRRLWNVAGTISVGIGIAGVFLPLLPTVPLFLLAGFCYWRGSPRFYNRLISFGPVGRLVDNFQKGKGLPAKMKSRAIVFMWVSLATSMIFFVNSNALRAVMVLIGISVTLYILRIKTTDPVIHPTGQQKIPAGTDPVKGE